ncbi:fibronectin type III domain-containing protein [Fibrella forsythiae]|uniref:Fibronectin type III domain-containing protein n=1 Tax=Fibrella forsythiae TaxID=2817061 RepID=A0ABS3JSI7_9BACT|nr:fibronectin type III domain-containing protein [Fibrella forsythiae]MBO0952974.1 fibronectin type III domain-containing protein [Fibrella forsythiae]
MDKLRQLLFLTCLLIPVASLWAQTPLAPTNLAVIRYGNVGMELSWTDGTTNETGFEIHSSPNNSTFTKLADVPAHAGYGGMTYVLTGLSENTLYYLKVRAKVGTTFTNFTNTISQRTSEYRAPNDLKLTVKSPTWVQLTWSDIVKEGSYEVERRTGQSGRWGKLGESGAGYDDKTASESTEYCYRVRLTGSSDIVNYPYPNAPCITTTSSKPPAPTGLSAQVISSFQIDLSWTPSTGSYDGTEVEYSTDNRSFQKYGNTIRPGTNRQSATGLSPNTRYWFRVRATNGSNTPSDYSNTVDATTNPEIPITPTGLTVSVTSSSQLQIYWNDSNVIPVIYSLERAEGPGGTYREIDGSYPSKIYNDKNLNPSTQYCYRVRAKSTSGGYSNYSTPACNTTQAPPITVPRPPTEMLLQVQSARQINMIWKDNSDNETSFRVERSEDGGRTWTTISDEKQNATSYNDAGLSPDRQYCYRVKAINSAGESLPSNQPCATTQPDKPSAPARLTAIAISASQIRLEWANTASNATGIQVERSETGSGGSFSKVKDLGPTETNWTNEGLTASKEYCYRIKAVNAAGSSDSETKCATTPAPPVTTPAPPTELALQAVNDKQITLRWKDNSDNETGFAIERSTDGKRTWQRHKDVGQNVTNYDDGGLNASSQYCYRVLAFNTAGNSRTTNEECATTQAPPIMAPKDPSNLKATAKSSSEIDLTWTDNSDNETRFELQRSLTGNDPWENVDANIQANSISKTDGGRSPSTRYYYRIRAVTVAQSGALLYSNWSNTANDITQAPPVTVPRPPSNLKVEAQSSTAVRLTWEDNSDNESEFEIWWATSQTAQFTKLTNVPANQKDYTHTGLTASTQYCYQVRAINLAGQSSFAGPTCATTQAPPVTAPAPPTDFVANAASTSSINLSWKDNSPNETGFDLQWSATNADPWTSLPTQAANVTTYSHTELTPNTRYYYRLRAVNGTLASGWVTTSTITPSLPVPSTTADLKAEVADYDQIKLTWGAINNTPTGVVVERSTSPTGSFTQVGQVSGTATAFTDTGLPELTTFYYRIRSTNANGQSGNSNLASAKTPETIIAVRPQPLPEGIYAHVDRGTLLVTLNWNQFQEAKLRLIGLNGREQLTDQCRINGGTLFQYDVARLPAGVYLLCLDTDKNRFTKKIWIP